MAIRGIRRQGAMGLVAGAVFAMALPLGAAERRTVGTRHQQPIHVQERRRRGRAQRDGPRSAGPTPRRPRPRPVQRLRGRRPPGHRLLRDQRGAARPGASHRHQRQHGAQAGLRAAGGHRLRRRACAAATGPRSSPSATTSGRSRPSRRIATSSARPSARRPRAAAPRSTTRSTSRCGPSTRWRPTTARSAAAPSWSSPTARTPPAS